MSNLRVGMMVRYVGTTRVQVGGKCIPSPNTGKVGTITEALGMVVGHAGGVLERWHTTIDSSSFAGKCLIPINPDNEACGSFEDMMNALNKETVKVRS
jgi:hypothetical protein